MVSGGLAFASPSMLRFRKPENFVAGNLSECLPHWEVVLKDYPKAAEIFRYVSQGVYVQEFFVPFNGTYRGRSYNTNVPPRMSFPNSLSCNNFRDFVSQTILERVANGSLLVWGEVGKVDPPHLVMPITVEPSKPRMCHDERFLNCWIKDCPFSLDYITDLPRYVGDGHYQTTFDDRSGYDHVRLHPSSSTFFGLEWEGWYFTYSTLPFGWKASAYIYHSIGLAATCFVRSLGVPCSQYIDDRHIGQLRLPHSQLPPSFSGFQLAEMAAYIACVTFISLGYFIGIKKSCLIPSVAVRFLGYICDSEKQAFLLPQEKRDKFATLREGILSHKTVSLKNIQKFAGKTTSFALLVPAAKLFTNTTYQTISRGVKRANTQLRISPELRRELLHWRFLDSWEGFLPWKSERHIHLTMHSDASFSGWGGCLNFPGQPPMQSRGLWSEATRCLPIAVKEAQALFNTLESLCSDTHNARIDAFVDNMALLHSWERQVSKSSAMSDILKDIFSFTLSRNLSLNLMYVPSRDNPADAPSRSLSDLDCSLIPAAWLQVDKAFGPHTIDLMALPFNVQNNRAGCPLRFFSPFPCTQAFGVNVFAQDISSDENAYVFPPFVLIGPLLKYLRSQLCTFSIVVPDLCPRKFWWPLVQRTASSSFKLGSKGDADILLFPAKSGPAILEPRPLQWDLWVFRIPSAS